MICPKCQHIRGDKDDPLVPDYECPACGVIYAKYKPKQTTPEGQPAVFTIDESPGINTFRNPPKINKPTIELENSHQEIPNKDSLLKQPIVTGNLKTILVCGVVLFFLAKVYISPIQFMNDFRDALFNKDANDLTEYIDFEKLRTNIKASVHARVIEKTQPQTDAFSQLGAALGMQLVDNMIDKAISPFGIKAIFLQQSVDKKPAEDFTFFKFHYLDFDNAIVDLDSTKLKIERRGLFSWIIIAGNLDLSPATKDINTNAR